MLPRVQSCTFQMCTQCRRSQQKSPHWSSNVQESSCHMCSMRWRPLLGSTSLLRRPCKLQSCLLLQQSSKCPECTPCRRSGRRLRRPCCSAPWDRNCKPPRRWLQLSGSISRPHTSCKRSATLPLPLRSRCPSRSECIEQKLTSLCRCSSGLLDSSGKLLAQWHLPGYSTSQLRSCGSHSLRSGHARHSMFL